MINVSRLLSLAAYFEKLAELNVGTAWWITPSGELISLSGDYHSTYAEKELERLGLPVPKPDYDNENTKAVDMLVALGYIRIRYIHFGFVRGILAISLDKINKRNIDKVIDTILDKYSFKSDTSVEIDDLTGAIQEMPISDFLFMEDGEVSYGQ